MIHNKDENDLIQKEAINGKDYFLINYDDLRLLKNDFRSTNEIKRKKDNIDMVNFGVIIFDQRFIKYKNNNINLLKKKNKNNQKIIKDNNPQTNKIRMK